MQEHLDAACPLGARCDICLKTMPAAARSEHDRTAADLHVAVLKRRCDDLQQVQERLLAQSSGLWRLRPGSVAALAKGRGLATSPSVFDHPGWPSQLSGKLRFFPRGLEGTPEGQAAMEVEFEAAECVLQLLVRLVAGAGAGFARDCCLDLSSRSAATAKHTWRDFCPLAEEQLEGELRIHLVVKEASAVLRTREGRA